MSGSNGPSQMLKDHFSPAGIISGFLFTDLELLRSLVNTQISFVLPTQKSVVLCAVPGLRHYDYVTKCERRGRGVKGQGRDADVGGEGRAEDVETWREINVPDTHFTMLKLKLAK